MPNNLSGPYKSITYVKYDKVELSKVYTKAKQWEAAEHVCRQSAKIRGAQGNLPLASISQYHANDGHGQMQKRGIKKRLRLTNNLVILEARQ